MDLEGWWEWGPWGQGGAQGPPKAWDQNNPWLALLTSSSLASSYKEPGDCGLGLVYCRSCSKVLQIRHCKIDLGLTAPFSEREMGGARGEEAMFRGAGFNERGDTPDPL